MKTVLITGGTGLTGRALTQALLQKGYRVVILSRQPGQQSGNANPVFAEWNVEQQTIDKEVIATADYIIHLAGAGVADKRWSAKRKQEIISSRVLSSKLIVDSLKNIPNNVQAVISASAIGWYGPDPQIPNTHPFREEAPNHDDFLGTTCRQWEESIESVRQLGKRLVKLRIGIVLSKQGGALKEFLKPLRFGVAAILGNGRQLISWIHIDDLVKLYIAAIENGNMQGVYNAVAPNPVSNKELTLTLARSRKKFFIPVRVPSFLLKLVLGGMSVEVLKSATVNCDKVLQTGFQFQYSNIAAALDNCR
ncbi:MAG: TIGR01777 family oxidoreductase [Chitinophagaceae bacterium]